MKSILDSLGLSPAKKTELNILHNVGGVIKPGRYVFQEQLHLQILHLRRLDLQLDTSLLVSFSLSNCINLVFVDYTHRQIWICSYPESGNCNHLVIVTLQNDVVAGATKLRENHTATHSLRQS
jgi:hypothetical protein